MLSILIPAYNYDITALVNVLHVQCTQYAVEFEIVVADDSPYAAVSITNKTIESLPNCRFITNPHNLGRTLTRKKLAAEAAYQTLLFLDADVMPAHDSFIKHYAEHIGTNQVIVGGYAYKSDPENRSLRLKYGLHREQETAAKRNRHPYGYVFSGNFLINKEVFLQNNYPDNDNFYGLDNYFSYSLYKNNVTVLHIDNPIYHLGLESDEVFFEKCLESVRIRKLLLAGKEGIEDINALLRHYKKLQHYGLTGPVSMAFKLSAPVLKYLVLRHKNLLALDVYRLGYLCTLK